MASPKRAVLGLFVVALILFILFVHPFLAVTHRVDADVLVIEGWIPDYMSPAAVKEFHQGKYALFFVSGLENDPARNQIPSPSAAAHTAARLTELGVPRDAIRSCPAPFARWLRTSQTAQAVREKMIELGIKPKGINVITAGPHARETWVAYEHIFGNEMPVGIISIPKNNYPADRWWTSRQGLIWVPKDFIAWVKEVLIGHRN
ncbi:MAG: hypothetical protein ABI387_00970 [Lacunisphaera sp.]